MKNLIDILKSSLWGLMMLIFVALIGISATSISIRSTQFISSESTSKHQKVYAELESVYKENEGKLEELKYPKSEVFIGKIRTVIDNCGVDCWRHERFFVSLEEPYELTFLRFLENAKKLTDYNIVRKSNYSIMLSIISLAINIALCLYMIYGLFCYKRIGFQKIVFLCLFFAPFILISIVIGFTYNSSEIEFQVSDQQFIVLSSSIVYFFIVFPPIVQIYSKNGNKIIDIILLRQ
jgi:hypothetical protein